MLKIRRTGAAPVMDIIKTENPDGSALLYMQVPAVRATGIVEHAFSTRIGGTSQGIFSSMNLRFGHGDEDARVRENFHRMASVLGTDEAHMVLTKQTHTTNVRVVTAADAGYGVVRERPYDDVDGLITDVPGLALGIFAADCVP
ncbi:MAG: laccase domain-containing protein, partial [Oliverpabstia sp.]|nr:laccase domain-containing protein [Oliverpabstia sp.]